MKINKPSSKTVPLQGIPTGECFSTTYGVFMKILSAHRFESLSNNVILAINMDSGNLTYFATDSVVFPLKTELNVI